MTHNELIQAIIARKECRRFHVNDLATILVALATVTAEQIAAGREVRLKGIGTLKATYHAPPHGAQPQDRRRSERAGHLCAQDGVSQADQRCGCCGERG